MALLILNAATFYRNTLKLVENERWVSHTHKVLTELETTLSTLKNAETGQRGYLVTGK
ncbi:CHASE3 domain-containing protein [Microcoleus sp. POL10_C6]|uniref:CHASE3 domain-containing protein n=1 Tax=unclassified Microcoleus TaxID=2642155 RepID=UPI002FD0D2B1